MLNETKIICADMMFAKRKRDEAKKKVDKHLNTAIKMTSGAAMPTTETMEDLQLHLMEEQKYTKDLLKLTQELNDLWSRNEMQQAVMNLGGTDGNEL